MRPTHAEIDLRAIDANLRNIRRHIGRHPLIMAVVKANAYGHGAVPVAKEIVRRNSAQYLGVAIVEEGMELRTAGIGLPVHVFTAPFRHQLPLFIEYRLEPTICDMSVARALNVLAAKKGVVVPVHVKIDTGMGRIGVKAAEAIPFVESVLKLKNISVKGIWTHFATSDDRDLSFAEHQLSLFRSIVTGLELRGIHIPLVHCANSGAILQMPDAWFDMVRPGIMMYGYTPSRSTRRTVPLRPAMSLKAKVGFVKEVPKGTSISYSLRYVTKRRSTIASVTVGYADGYFRTLTNRTSVLIRGKRYPVAGTVCMDQIMVDTGSDKVKVGDDVVLIGSSGSQRITGWDIAAAAGTIPYEVTCAVSPRVPRIYRHGK
ncbi:MAG: alanine racemase [Bacteroidetes bacterium]|nr:alanine racemase [Bacteroidota bacterium]